jgi:hypothetical protein
LRESYEFVPTLICRALKSYQFYRCLRPGGWAEVKDMDFHPHSDDDSLPADSAIANWHHQIDAGSKLGVQRVNVRLSALDLVCSFEKAGFVNVTIMNFKLPIGTWPKDQKMKERGVWQRQIIEKGLEAYSMAVLTRLLKWDQAQIQILLSRVRKELKNTSYHWYWPL